MKRFLISCLLMTALSTTASAVPVQWNLAGADFINGNGSVTGSFVYDADTNAVTDVNVGTTAGTLLLVQNGQFNPFLPFPGATLGGSSSGFTTGGGLFALLFSGDGFNSQLLMWFNDPLTNDGGVVGLNRVFHWVCPTSAFCNRDLVATPFRSTGQFVGSVTATAIPEPSTLLLMGLGLLALVRQRR